MRYQWSASLEYLDAQSTTIGAGLEWDSALFLHLYGATINAENLSHLSSLTALKVLRIDGTRVGDQGLQHLAGLVNLETLWVDQQVTDAGRFAPGAHDTPQEA